MTQRHRLCVEQAQGAALVVRQRGVALLEMEEALIGGALGKYKVQFFDLFPNHSLAPELKKRRLQPSSRPRECHLDGPAAMASVLLELAVQHR